MTFETVPVVHLDRSRFPEFPDADPEAALAQLAKRFERIAIVDVEGIRTNEPHVEFIQTASRKRSLWVDAGSRYAEDAMDLFIAGADTVTMRWNTLDSPKELDEAASLCQPGSLLLGLEFPRGAFLHHARDKRGAADVARFAESLGVGLVILTDSVDALRAAPLTTTARYAQGVRRADAARAQEMGYQGALLAPIDLGEDAP